MPGVPSARLNVSFLDIIPGINISLDQGLVWYDFENIDHNFFLSSLSLMSSNFQAGVVLGYSQGILPVLGMNASITFPFNTIMLWEGVLRQESFRAYVDDDLIQEYRERLFFNQSVRLETTQKEPLFQNSISCYAEYFYYDEGFSKAQFNNIYDYLETQDINVLLIPEYYDLIIPERNFRHYLTLGTGYVTQENWSFLYKSIAELTNGIWQHWFTIGKAFDNVMIGLSVIYIPPLAKKYQLIYGARDLLFYFQISMEL
jgi:uncharacterized protein YozE (UPF0346 family)